MLVQSSSSAASATLAQYGVRTGPEQARSGQVQAALVLMQDTIEISTEGMQAAFGTTAFALTTDEYSYSGISSSLVAKAAEGQTLNLEASVRTQGVAAAFSVEADQIETDIAMHSDGTHALLRIGVTTGAGDDTIRFRGQFAGDDQGSGTHSQLTIDAGAGNDVISVELEDGPGLTFNRAFISGGEGNDTLVQGGGSGHTTLDGGAGDDIIVTTQRFARIRGGQGDDRLSLGLGNTIEFNQGDGNDTATLDRASTSAMPPGGEMIGIILGTGQNGADAIRFDEVEVTRDGSDLILNHGGGAGSLRLKGMANSDVDLNIRTDEGLIRGKARNLATGLGLDFTA